MHKALSPLVAAGLLVVAACGGSDDDDASSDDAGGDFCSEYATFDERAQDIAAGLATRDPDDQDDREAVAGEYDRMVEALRAVEPPDEIAEAWDDAIASSSALAEGLRSDDESEVARVMEDAEADTWSDDIEAYVTRECEPR